MWTFQGRPFEPDDAEIDQYVGFVYVITEKATGIKYVGKKLLWKVITRPPLKGKTRKRKQRVQSDWREYFGSSDNVKLLVEQHGSEAFDREILRLCKTKGELSYFEAKEQFDRDVLLRDDYYNGIINCRINQQHVKHLRCQDSA